MTGQKRRGISAPGAMVPPPEGRAKRDRGWEAAERKRGQVTYRGVPAEVREAILEIAQGQYVPADDVARLLLEYALAAYRRGEVRVERFLEDGRFRLFSRRG